MRPGDLFGDRAQRGIARPGIFEAIFGDRHGVRSAAPFADKTGAWLQTEARRQANLARRPQRLRHRLQLAADRLREAAALDLLKPVTERENKQIAADPRRLAAMQPPPFAAQMLEPERLKASDLALNRLCVCLRHG